MYILHLALKIARVGRVAEDPGEDVRVGVGVGVVECQLYGSSLMVSNRLPARGSCGLADPCIAIIPPAHSRVTTTSPLGYSARSVGRSVGSWNRAPRGQPH